MAMITSISEDFSKIHRRTQVSDLELIYNKLNIFVEKINEKIVNRIQLVQSAYAEDYQLQVSTMAAQLKSMRNLFDAEVIKQKSNQNLFYLEEERDYFRQQVLKINQEVNKLTEINKQLKLELDASRQQAQHFKIILKNHEMKLLKLKQQNIEMNRLKNQCFLKKEKVSTSLPKQKAQEKETTIQTEIKQSKFNRTYSNPRFNTNSMRNLTLQEGRMKNDSLTRASFKKYSEHQERQEIIDSCIKQIKKQIYYRSVDSKDQNKLHFDDFNKITISRMTKTDKKELISNILQNQFIFAQFSEYIHSRKNQEVGQSAVRVKLSDDPQNNKFLSEIKRQFNKRILDLKTGKD